MTKAQRLCPTCGSKNKGGASVCWVCKNPLRGSETIKATTFRGVSTGIQSRPSVLLASIVVMAGLYSFGVVTFLLVPFWLIFQFGKKREKNSPTDTDRVFGAVVSVVATTIGVIFIVVLIGAIISYLTCAYPRWK